MNTLTKTFQENIEFVENSCQSLGLECEKNLTKGNAEFKIFAREANEKALIAVNITDKIYLRCLDFETSNSTLSNIWKALKSLKMLDLAFQTKRIALLEKPNDTK